MDPKNVDDRLREILQVLELKKRQVAAGEPLTPSEAKSVTRMREVMARVPMVGRLSNRFDLVGKLGALTTNKRVAINNHIENMYDDFCSHLDGFWRRLEALEALMVGFEGRTAEKTTDFGALGLEILKFLLPVSDCLVLSRNTEFRDFNTSNFRTDQFRLEGLFGELEEHHSDLREPYSYLTWDSETRTQLSRHLRLNKDRGYGSIWLHVPQTARMVESTVIFIIGFSSESTETIGLTLQDPQITGLVHEALKTIFWVHQRKTEGKLMPAKLQSKNISLRALFGLSALHLLEVQTLTDPLGSMCLVARNPNAASDLTHLGYSVSLSKFDLDLCFRKFRGKKLTIPEHTALITDLEARFADFKRLLERKTNQILLQKFYQKGLGYLELTAELQVTRIELANVPHPFLGHLGRLTPGKTLAETIVTPLIQEVITERLGQHMNKTDAQAITTFLLGEFKIKIGFRSLMEGHVSKEGPVFFVMVFPAPKDDQRICFDFMDVPSQQESGGLASGDPSSSSPAE